MLTYADVCRTPKSEGQHINSVNSPQRNAPGAPGLGGVCVRERERECVCVCVVFIYM